MAVARQVDAQTIGRLYADSVRELGFVGSVHVRETDDGLEVWVVTGPTAIESEEPLYQAAVDLEDRFPDAGIVVHVVNPLDYPAEHDLIRDVIPARAIEAANLR